MEEGKARIEKFDGKDFGFWRMQIEDLLYQKELYLPLKEKPESMKDTEWQVLDRQALGMVRLTLARNVAYNVMNQKTTAGLLKALANMYEKPSAMNKIHSNYMNFATQTYEQAVDCLNTNYYGVKRTIEALLPLLQLSDSPRIVNVSSSMGKLAQIPSEGIRETLSNIENLTEEKLDEVINEFLRDFKNGSFMGKGWPSFLTAYTVSKAILNSYTRILAKKYPSYIINCLCPGYVKTDINNNTGILSVEEGGATCVRLALLPRGADSGLFFSRDEVSSFV